MKNYIHCLSEPSFDSQLIDIECRLGKGLPIMTIVGLPGRSVTESRDRLRAAFQASDIPFPRKRLTINLAPADLPKRGGGFDLAIAAAILQSGNLIPQRSLPIKAGYIGELGLDGTIKPVAGIIGRLVSAKRSGLDLLYIPEPNLSQASLVPGLKLVPISDLKQLYEYCHGLVAINPIKTTSYNDIETSSSRPEALFSTVSGQAGAKRALAIAAAGGHNLLLQGRPGTGKSLLGRCLTDLLPPMSLEERLYVTHMLSITSDVQTVAAKRPVVVPHPSISPTALVYGSAIKPGAIMQAAGGVLILDELPEFSRVAIEALRQPLETPIDPSLQIVATANPCPCGYSGHKTIECRCTSYNISRYRQKLSGPIYDRIDIFTTADDIDHQTLLDTPHDTELIAIRRAVLVARQRQATRYGSARLMNATCPDSLFKQTCRLSPKAKSLLDQAAATLNVSARNYMRSLRIARSIADLAGKPAISPQHIAEALCFRPRQPGNP